MIIRRGGTGGRSGFLLLNAALATGPSPSGRVYAGRRTPAGSMLLLLNTAAAAGDVRNVSQALAASADFAPICIPLEKTVTVWMSAGSGPT